MAEQYTPEQIAFQKQKAKEMLERYEHFAAFEIAEMEAAAILGWVRSEKGICEDCMDGCSVGATINNHQVWVDADDHECAYCYLKKQNITLLCPQDADDDESASHRYTMEYMHTITNLFPNLPNYQGLLVQRQLEIQEGENGYTEPDLLDELLCIKEHGYLLDQ